MLTGSRAQKAQTIGANAPRRRQGGLSRRMWRKTLVFYAYIAPFLLGVVVLTVVPLVLGIILSFTDYDGLNLSFPPDPSRPLSFVGVDNYTRAFGDWEVRLSFVQSLRWVSLNVPLWVGISFALALALHQDVKGRGLFRTLLYLPSVIPIVPTIWVWRQFLDKNYGLLNAILSVFRPGTAVPWLSEQALFGLTWISVWSGLGWGMVVFLAGLQDIPDELVEAARVDGANALQVFHHVTLPLMSPVIFFVVLNSVIGSFQQFMLPLLMSPSALVSQLATRPPDSVFFYMLNVFWQTFSYSRYGYSMALVWLMFVFLMVLAGLLFWSQRYWVYTEASERKERR